MITCMRNSIPSQSAFSTFNTRNKLKIHAISWLLIFLTVINRGRGDQLKVVELFLHLLVGFYLCILFIQSRIFVRQEMNILVMGLMIFVLVSKLLVDLFHLKVLDPPIVSILFVATLSRALASNLINGRIFTNFLAEECCPYDMAWGILNFEDLLVRHLESPGQLQKEENACLIRYCGLIEDFIRTTENVELRRSGLLVVRDKYEFYKFITKFLETHSLDDIWNLKLLLRFNLISLMASLVSFKKLSKTYMKLSKNSWREQLDCMVLIDLFKIKLDCFYKEKIPDERGPESSLRGMYSHLYFKEQEHQGPKVLDPMIVLVNKENYTDLCELMQEELKVKLQLNSKLRSEPSMHSKELFEYNSKLFLMNTRVNQTFEYLLKEAEVATYIMASAVFYFGSVDNNHSRATEVLKRYQLKMKKWANDGPVLMRITKENLSRESVIFRVNIESEKTGLILDMSADYSEYLGKPDNGVIVGRNINELFPGFINYQHSLMMKNMDGFLTLLNVQREFFIQGFDQYLRKVSFIVKFFPSVEQDISSVGVLRMLREKPYTLGLFDMELNKLSAEPLLYQVLDTGIDDFTQLGQISIDLANHVRFIISYQTKLKPLLTDLVLKEINGMEHIENSRIVFDSICKKSEEEGYIFLTSRTSKFRDQLKNLPFRVKIIFATFGGIPYIKLQFTFDLQFRYEKRVNHEMKKKLQTRKNFMEEKESEGVNFEDLSDSSETLFSLEDSKDNYIKAFEEILENVVSLGYFSPEFDTQFELMSNLCKCLNLLQSGDMHCKSPKAKSLMRPAWLTTMGLLLKDQNTGHEPNTPYFKEDDSGEENEPIDSKVENRANGQSDVASKIPRNSNMTFGNKSFDKVENHRKSSAALLKPDESKADSAPKRDKQQKQIVLKEENIEADFLESKKMKMVIRGREKKKKTEVKPAAMYNIIFHDAQNIREFGDASERERQAIDQRIHVQNGVNSIALATSGLLNLFVGLLKNAVQNPFGGQAQPKQKRGSSTGDMSELFKEMDVPNLQRSNLYIKTCFENIPRFSYNRFMVASFCSSVTVSVLFLGMALIMSTILSTAIINQAKVAQSLANTYASCHRLMLQLTDVHQISLFGFTDNQNRNNAYEIAFGTSRYLELLFEDQETKVNSIRSLQERLYSILITDRDAYYSVDLRTKALENLETIQHFLKSEFSSVLEGKASLFYSRRSALLYTNEIIEKIVARSSELHEINTMKTQSIDRTQQVRELLPDMRFIMKNGMGSFSQGYLKFFDYLVEELELEKSHFDSLTLGVMSIFLIFTLSSFGLVLFCLFKRTQAINRNLNCYSYLKQQEIYIQREMMERYQGILDQYRYQEEVLMTSMSKEPELLLNTRARLEKEFKRKKYNTQGVTVKANPYFNFATSLIRINVGILLASSILLLCGWLGSSYIRTELHIQYFLWKSVKHMIMVGSAFESATMYSYGGDRYPVFNKKYDPGYFSDSWSTFHTFWSSEQHIFQPILKESSHTSLKELMYGNLCDALYSEDSTRSKKHELLLNFCRIKFSSVTSRGFIQFINLEETYIEEIYSKVASQTAWLQQNQVDSDLTLSGQSSPAFFEPEFIQLRMLHGEFFLKVHETFSRISEEEILRNQNRARLVIQNILLPLMLLFTLSGLLSLPTITRRMNEEGRCSIHTFKIIMPEIIVNNRLLLSYARQLFQIAYIN